VIKQSKKNWKKEKKNTKKAKARIFNDNQNHNQNTNVSEYPIQNNTTLNFLSDFSQQDEDWSYDSQYYSIPNNPLPYNSLYSQQIPLSYYNNPYNNMPYYSQYNPYISQNLNYSYNTQLNHDNTYNHGKYFSNIT